MMSEMDAQGFLTLDGVLYRRARDLESRPVASKPIPERTEIVSNSLGFTDHSLPAMREHLERSGVRGIEFVPDPEVDGFTQVRCSSEKAKRKYMQARGLFDKNSRNGGGATLSEKEFNDAKELLSRRYASQPLEGITNG